MASGRIEPRTQGKIKGRTLTGCRFQPQPPALPLDMLARNREPGPGAAAIVVAAMQSPENREDRLPVPLGNADAIVPHEEGGLRVGLVADLDPFLGLVVIFNGIGDQVLEDGGRAYRVAGEARELCRDLDLGPRLPDAAGQGRDDRSQQLIEIHLLHRERLLARTRIL